MSLRSHIKLIIIIMSSSIYCVPSSAATYSSSSDTYSWINPSSHTNVVWTAASGGPANECTSASAAIDDDITQELNLGFTFSFGGTDYTTVRVMSNGRLQFNNTFCGFGTSSNSVPRIFPYPMPDTRLSRTMRVYGADLDPSAGSGTVKYASSGSSPNRSFIVTWTNVREWGSSGSDFNLQVILYENGSFKYQYGNITNERQGHAQIGWEVGTDDYELYIYGNETNIQGKAILFSADNPTPKALYSLDEITWSGASGEIRDSSVNSLNGSAIGGAQTVSNGYVCRGGEVTANGQAIDTSVNPASTLGSRGTLSFWYNNSSSWTSGNKMLADASRDFGTSASNDKYFFLVKRSNGILRFVLEASNDVDLVAQTGNNNFAADTWHHVAIAWDLNESADYLQIYVDGTRQATSRGNRTSPLTIPDTLGSLNSMYIGDNRTTGVTGSNYSSSAATGIYDEVYFFDEVLSSTQISNNMSATHACILGAWNMDESAWSGVANEVVDASGLGKHGTAVNGATTNTSIPAIAGSPGTCGYGQFDGTNDYVALPGFDNLNESFTIAAWIRPDRVDKDQRIFVDDESNAGGFAFSLGDPGDGRLRLFSRGVSPVSLDTSAVINVNTWYHVAAVHDSTAKTRQIFVNGVAVTTAQTYTGTWGTDNGTASIGGETNAAGSEANSNWRFDGSIDEVRVYAKAMSSTEIVSVMNETRTCSISFNHIRITHDGTALTCEPETITVQACANSSCSTAYTSDVNVTLTPTGWVGGDTQTISGGSSTFQLSKTTAATYALGFSGASPAPSSSTAQCVNTGASDTSCDITFYNTGFIYDVPNLTSCAASANVTVSAVRLDNTSQACIPTFQSLTKTVKFGSSYSSPASGSEQVVINSSGTDYPIDTSSPVTDVPLAFNASGQATITVTYDDAGSLALNSSYTNGALTMVGSDSFITTPAKLYVYSDDANSACASNDASCSAMTSAGSNFNLKVRAACADNTVTPNFILNNIAMTHTNTQPAIAQGSISTSTFNIADADNGENASITQSVTEVGVFTFTATAPTYLGTTGPSGTSTYIGRFTPGHICVSGTGVTNRTDSNSKAACTDSFSYLSEDFTNTFTLTAQRAGATCGDGSSTINYTSTFSKFDTSAILSGDNTSDATETGVFNFAAIDSASSTNLSSSINFNSASSTSSGEFTNGTLSVTAKMDIARSGSSPSYTAASPYTDVEIGIKPIDADNVTLSSTDLTISSVNYSNAGNTALYFGRLYADNTFGAENEGLPMWAEPQYCNAQSSGVCTDWKTKSDDTCSLFTVTAPTDTIVKESISGTNGYWVSGTDYSASSGITYTTDSNGYKAGWKIWYTGSSTGGTYTIPFVTHPYLITQDGSASFGLYRGDDRIIYWQEIFE